MDPKELRRLAAEVDEEHRKAMRSFELGRRALLRTAGLGGLAVVAGGGTLAALSGAASAQTTSTTTTTAGTTTAAAATTTTTLPPASPQSSDLLLMSFAQSLELAVVQLYDTVITSGKLDTTTASVVGTFQSHHRQHAQSYAALAGKAALNRANPGLISLWGPKFQSAGSQTELLRQAYDLENAAATSYTAALARVIGTNPAALMASILPTEARHAIVFGQAIGVSPSSLSPPFESTSGALTPDQYPVAGQ